MQPGLLAPVLPFALPSILHVQQSSVQKWTSIVIGAHGAGVLIGSPIVGYFADHCSSRRIPYLFGLAALAAATIAMSLGRSTTVLLVGRMIQGAATASANSVGMAILADTVGDAGVGPAMGVVDISIALGATISPVAGGFLYHWFGYFAVFESVYVLIVVDLVLRCLMREREREGRRKDLGTSEDGGEVSKKQSDGINVEQATSLMPDDDRERRGGSGVRSHRGGYGSIRDGTNDQDYHSTTINRDNGFLRKPGCDPSDHILRKSHKPHGHPMLTLLSTSRMCAALLSNFAQSVILCGLEAVLPLHIKTTFHYTSKGVSLIFLTLALPSFASPFIGRLSDKIGAKIIVSVGFASLSVLLFLLGRIDHDGTEQMVFLCTLIFLIGICLNMTLTPALSDVTYLIDEMVAAEPGIFGAKKAYAQGFALMGMAYSIGSFLGPMLGGLLLEKTDWKSLMSTAGGLCVMCSIPAFLALGRGKKRTEF